MSTRRIPEPTFAGDEGHVDAALSRALAAWAGDPGRRPEVLAALHSARVLVPVVASLGEGEETAGGLRAEKSSDIAIPLLVGEDGRTALPAFSSMATLGRWDGSARPVPVVGAHAARVALEESAVVLALDVAGPLPCALEEREVSALAHGRGRVPAYQDARLAAALGAVFAAERDVREAWLRPWPGSDARLDVRLGTSGEGTTREVAQRLTATVQGIPEIASAAVRGIDLAVTDGPAASDREPSAHRLVFRSPTGD